MLNRLIKKLRIRNIYRTNDYINAYREHTNLRVDEDPHSAIGGRWEHMGELQFSFLTQQGLRPVHKMLDIGCGTLRGGRHFIRYLDTGNYAGMEISPKAIEYARQLIEAERLADKEPTIVLNSSGDLCFSQISGKFDYVLAQSVFTHLPQEYLEQAFANIRKVMNQEAVFFFTIYKASRSERTGLKTFRYPLRTIKDIVEGNGFQLEEHIYAHPGGQSMLAIRNRC